MDDLREEAKSIAFRLPSHQAEWIARNHPIEEWCPPRMAIALLRMGLIKSDDAEGGFCLTVLGREVSAFLKERLND